MAEVNLHGPLFTGALQAAVRQGVEEAKTEIADQGRTMVVARLHRVLQHPTGHYWSRVRVGASGGNPAVVDGGVVYGPWLEGTGSRNRTTRFKGYRTFRVITGQLQDQAVGIAASIISRRIGSA